MTIPTAEDLPQRAAEVPPFQLGEWQVLPALNRIGADGRQWQLEPRMMHVLVCLAAAPDEVLSRRLLLDVVWRDTVVGEEALTRAISRLRDLLGDDRRQPRYIETIRGGGYRLLVQPHAAEQRPPATDRDHRSPRAGSRFKPALWLLLAAVAATLFALTRTDCERGAEPPWPLAVLEAQPLTSLPGSEAFPAVAPDGRTIAFAWTGADLEPAGIFLTQRGLAEPHRLTSTPGYDYHPAFSPTGDAVAFVRSHQRKRSIYVVPALGGEPRLLIDLHSPVFGLTWSTQDGQIYFAALNAPDGAYCVNRIHPDSLQVEDVTIPDRTTHTGDSWPAVSPDASTLVFARCDHAGLRDLWEVPLTGGVGRPLTVGLDDIRGLVWLPGSRQVIVAAAPDGRLGLWRLWLDRDRRDRLPTTAPGRAMHPVLAAGGRDLIFRSEVRDHDLRFVALGDSSVPVINFAVSTQSDRLAAWSPDGRQVAFVSERSGKPELWLADATGDRLRRLSNWTESELLQPFWSPDGLRLAVTLRAATQSRVVVLEVASGHTVTHLDDGTHVRLTGWHPDGQKLYLLRDVADYWQLFTYDLETGDLHADSLHLSGHPRVITTDDASWYVDSTEGGLWRWPRAGAEPEPVISPAATRNWRSWQLQGGEVYAIVTLAGGQTAVYAFDLQDESARLVRNLPAAAGQLALAPGGDAALVTILAEVAADLMIASLAGLD